MRYVLIDRITALEPGHSLHGFKNVSASDSLVVRYAHGVSALPATLVLESMAQAAGALLSVTIDFAAQPVLAKVQPFAAYALARPGDRIEIRVELQERRADGCRACATASVDGRRIADATIYLALVPFDHTPSETRRERMRARMADVFPDWFGAALHGEVPA